MAIVNIPATVFIVAEYDPTDSAQTNDLSYIVKSSPTDIQGTLDITWVGQLGDGGCVGLISNNFVDPTDDSMNGYMTIEKIG